VGAACLCGIGDILALLVADRALPAATASVAKLGVLCGSIAAAAIGAAILYRRPRPGKVSGPSFARQPTDTAAAET
jgi:Na+/H+ antiporter NhaA